MKNLLLFTVLFLLLFTSCKKEERPKPTESYYMSAELKSYYFFPKGSWWVYKRTDTTATIYDTATVVNSVSEMIFDELAPFEWEHVAVNIEHTHYPSSPRSASPYLNIYIRNDAGFTDRISMTSQGKLFSYLPYFFSVPIDSLSMENKSHVPNSPILLDTNDVVINNQTFKLVVHLKNGSTDFKYDIWIARNVGIVKYFNTGDSTHWEVVDYHIN